MNLQPLSALSPDRKNARRRTERSSALLEHSLSQYGAARSIVIDEEGVVLAGNGTLEAAAAIGIDQVLVVPADGNTLVAVQRTDLSPRQKVEYALADNRASDLSEWDAATLSDLVNDDPDLNLNAFFSDDEFKAILEEGGVGQDEDPEDDGSKSQGKLEVKLAFEDPADFDTFLQSLQQLSAALPKLKKTEARLQYVVDKFLAGDA